MRLPPLPDEQWDERARAALAPVLPESRRNLRSAGNALGALVRHPDLARSFLGFTAHLLVRSTLPVRLRELVILRIARRRECVYEWVHHVQMGADAGLTGAEIEAAGRGEATGELDQAVLTATDELDATSTLSDKTWALLGEHLDERQRMDLVLTIGGYCMTAMAFNAFGVEPEA
jgi:4-carboxymuconolactone decarboxylase